MIHSKPNNVAIMWQELDKKKREKGLHTTKFNVDDSTTLSVGDDVLIGYDTIDNAIMWRVNTISESRPSTLKGYTYMTCDCTFIRCRL